MEINVRQQGNVDVIGISGRLDAVTSAEAEQQLLAAAQAGQGDMVLNLSGLDYVSSAGLRVLLAVGKHLKTRQASLRFVGLRGPVRDVFSISGFTSIFEVFETEAEALART